MVVLWATCSSLYAAEYKLNVYFDSDSDSLNFSQKTVIDSLVERIPFHDQYFEIYIVGHTDNEGSSTYNMDLSKRRADFVANLLQNKGVDEWSLATDFKGFFQPLVKNSSENHKQQNRRVEITLRTFNLQQPSDIITSLQGNEAQEFYFDNTVEQVIVGLNGMKFTFPPYCFDIQKGNNDDYKKIKLRIVEVNNLKQAIFSNALFESNDNILESGGMFKVEAFLGNQPLSIKKGVNYKVELPGNNYKNDMKVFLSPEGTNSRDGMVRWQNTSLPFNAVATNSVDLPCLWIDPDVIKAWEIKLPEANISKDYVQVMPKRPELPKKPMKPSMPAMPKMESKQFEMKGLKSLFSGKKLKEGYREQQYQLAMETYEEKMRLVQDKLKVYDQKMVEYNTAMEQYKKEFAEYQMKIEQLRIELLEFYDLMKYNSMESTFKIHKASLIKYMENNTFPFNSVNTFLNKVGIEIIYSKLKKDAMFNRFVEMKETLGKEYKKVFGKELKINERIRTDTFIELPFINAQYYKIIHEDKKFWSSVENAERDYRKLLARSNPMILNNMANGNFYYTASISGMGWINCDRFVNYKPDEMFTLQIDDFNTEKVHVVAILKRLKSQITVPKTNNGYRVNLPKDEEIVLMALSVGADKRPAYSLIPVEHKANSKIKMELKTATLDEIYSILDAI